ncbi:uncharacterized protein, partial [Chelonus insularis]|uniref:uncharacterized protein n=1 Tax=Chelonus insularis TaxID=460826 RepID=UPI00158C033A
MQTESQILDKSDLSEETIELLNQHDDNRKRAHDDNPPLDLSAPKQQCVESEEKVTEIPEFDNNFMYKAVPVDSERQLSVSYDIKNCQGIITQINSFLKKFSPYRINNLKSCYGERIVIYNALNNVKLYFSPDVPMTFDTINELFSISGHSLYLDLNHNYVTTLVLNLECKKCKNNTCTQKPSSKEHTLHLEQITADIWKELEMFLDLSLLNYRKNIFVFVKNNSCSLYIYFNISVSINVYAYIINALIKSQSDAMKQVLEQYQLNHFTYLPLPYLANRCDNNVYDLRPLWDNHKRSFDVIPSLTSYIDFKMQLSNDLNMSKDIVLAKIIYNYTTEPAQSLMYHDDVTKEWDITDRVEIETVYVMIILNQTLEANEAFGQQYPVCENDINGIPPFIRSRRKFIMESVNKHFKQFSHNLLKESQVNISTDITNYPQKFVFTHTSSNEVNHKILATLDSIGRNIARHVYQIEVSLPEVSKSTSDLASIQPSSNETSSQRDLSNVIKVSYTYRHIGYLIQFCYEPDNSIGYAFYVLILSIMYTMQKLSMSSNDRVLVISMLKQVLVVQQTIDNKQLLWILDSLQSVNCMSELERIFPEPLRILKQLATSVFLRRRVESRLVNDALSTANNNRTSISSSSSRSLVSTTPISYDVLLFDELCRLYLHEELSLYTHLSDLMLEEIVTTIFRQYLVLFYRNIMSNNVMYMYKDPLYIEHRMTNFVSDTTANSKLRFMYDKLLTFIIPILVSKCPKSNETRCRNQAFKIIKNAWYNYVNEHIPVKNVHFGKYRYFVCTLRGIFNNITGLYMCGIPQLYFENASSFCILPPLGIGDISSNLNNNDKNFGLFDVRSHSNTVSIVAAGDDVSGHNYHTHLREINDELIGRIDKWKKHVHIYITSQDKLFYLSVMVPGLLKIGESVFNKQTRSLIINTITDRLCNDNNQTNHEELFYLLPVIQYHSFDSNVIMALARCVDKLMNDKHTVVTSQTILNLFNGLYKSDVNNIYKEIGRNDDTKISYESYVNAVQLYDDIVKHYSYRPNRRIFALGFIWTLIEWDNRDDDTIAANFNIQHLSYNYRTLKEAISSAEPEDMSATLRGDPFGMTHRPFNLRQFTCETNENFRRAFDITFQSTALKPSTTSMEPEKDSVYRLDICMYNAFLSLSIIFRFDTKTIEDYLKHSTLIFQPFNNCRRFTLYYGEPRCGKSFLANLIIRAAEPSVFNVLSDLTTAASAASPSPDLIKAFQSYVVCIKEVRKLAESLLKTITGEDHMDQRDLYKGYQKLTPICFIFGCTNQIPQIDADEAVKDRLSIFHFTNRIEPCYNFRDSIDDNQLLLYINERTIQPQIEEFVTSIGLYNVFYGMFCLARNQFGLVIPTINNQSSKQIMAKFLIHNSTMYCIMNDCKIEVCVGYSIKMEDLLKRAGRAIEKSKRAMRTNYQLHDFIQDFSQHFRQFRVRNKATNNDEFIGVGLPPTDVNQVNVIDMIFSQVCRHLYNVPQSNTFVHISDIRKLIMSKLKAIFKTKIERETEYITRILLKVKSVYHEFYNIEQQCFHNIKIID